MVSVQTSSIEKKEKLSVYILNYPIIKSDNEKNIIDHINKRIYEDIISFKCAIEDISILKTIIYLVLVRITILPITIMTLSVYL